MENKALLNILVRVDGGNDAENDGTYRECKKTTTRSGGVRKSAARSLSVPETPLDEPPSRPRIQFVLANELTEMGHIGGISRVHWSHFIHKAR